MADNTSNYKHVSVWVIVTYFITFVLGVLGGWWWFSEHFNSFQPWLGYHYKYNEQRNKPNPKMIHNWYDPNLKNFNGWSPAYS